MRSRFFLVPLIALLIGWKSISVFFAFNFSGEFKPEKEKDAVRIVSWNVARFRELKRNNNAGSQIRLKMLDFLKQQNADVLCLQEFFHSDNSLYYANLDVVKNELNYPYCYYSRDDDGYLHYFGSVIFSRFPIIDSGIIRYPRPTLPEALIFADIQLPNDTVRIYTTHLQSFLFKPADYARIESIKNQGDGMLGNSKTIFSKVRRGVIYRSFQANTVEQLLQDSPYPKILCGDFNDVPNSYTYFTVRGGMQDAFLEEGFGIGRTFNSISPTLRIDYIFADHDYDILQFKRDVKNYSDHNMIVADLKLNKD